MRPSIGVVIAEDEPASRARLRGLLGRAADVRILAECATGEEALAALARHRPSVLFLDVRMPDMTGFDVLRAAGRAGLRMPAVVFVTAHERYAVSAFGVHALDYLLKPFDDERFERTMARVRSLVRARRALNALQGGRARNAAGSGPPTRGDIGASRLAISDGRGMMFVPLGALTHVTAEGCYARIHTVERSYLVREALASLAARLPSARVVRVHRSALVNLDAVQSLEPLSHGEFTLCLTTGDLVKASRTYRHDVLAALARPGRR